MQPSGHILYKDEYDAFYEVDWLTVGGVIDFTSTTRQPGVWGKPPEGYIDHGILFRKGVITVQRQVIKLNAKGYEIVAEGVSQYEDFIQMNFPCGPGPQDKFKFHLNNGMVDQVEARVTEGSRWADPAESSDENAIWGDIDSAGNPIPDTGSDVLAFVDVWS